MLTTTAIRYRDALKSGSSRPLVVEDDAGSVRLVRLRQSGTGVRGSITELVAYQLAAHFEIMVPELCLVRLNSALATQIVESEQREEVQRSLGINVATTLLPSATPIHADELSNFDGFSPEVVFLFDLMLLNFDRNERSSDLIQSAGVVFAVDFASAIGILNPMPSGIDSDQVLQQFKRHPCYRSNVNTKRFHELRAKIADSSVVAMVAHVPEEWLDELSLTRTDIVRAVHRMIDRAESVDESLRRISRFPPFDPTARRQTEKRNREQFNRRHDFL